MSQVVDSRQDYQTSLSLYKEELKEYTEKRTYYETKRKAEIVIDLAQKLDTTGYPRDDISTLLNVELGEWISERHIRRALSSIGFTRDYNNDTEESTGENRPMSDIVDKKVIDENTGEELTESTIHCPEAEDPLTDNLRSIVLLEDFKKKLYEKDKEIIELNNTIKQLNSEISILRKATDEEFKGQETFKDEMINLKNENKDLKQLVAQNAFNIKKIVPLDISSEDYHEFQEIVFKSKVDNPVKIFVDTENSKVVDFSLKSWEEDTHFTGENLLITIRDGVIKRRRNRQIIGDQVAPI